MRNPLKRKKGFYKKILKELRSLISLKIEFKYTAGWSSLVARQAHNLKVGGSNPSPATNSNNIYNTKIFLFYWELNIKKLCKKIEFQSFLLTDIKI